MAESASDESRMTFLARILLALLALVIVAAGFLYSAIFEARHREEVAKSLTAIAELKVDELLQWRWERLANLIVLRDNEAFSSLLARFQTDPGDSSARARLLVWMRQVNAAYGYDGISLFDASGAVLLDLPEKKAPDRSASGAILEILKRGSPDFVDFYRDPDEGRIFLGVAAPIGEGKGLVFLRIDPERYLYPFLERWPTTSATAETLIVRREGEDVVYLNRLKFEGESALLLRFPIKERPELPAAQVASGREGSFEGRDYRGIRVLSALRSVPGSPWALVARMDMSEVEAGNRERRFMLAVLVAALLGSEFAGILAATRRQRLSYLRRSVETLAALGVSEERLRLALSAGMLGLYDLDVSTGEMQINAEYATMLGFDPGTFRETKESWLDRLHPEDRDRVEGAFGDYLAGKAPEYRVEFRQRTASGEWKWILSLGKLIDLDGEGKPLRMIGTNTDIAERKELEAVLEARVAERTVQLEASNRELETFAYSVAHDLRAPLRSIDGFSHILQEEFAHALGAEGERLLGIVRDSAQKMDGLITNLLDVSRLGRMEMSYEVIDMKAMAGSAFAGVVDPEISGGFDFRVGGMPEVEGCPSMIERVWSNLFSNAVKYSLPSPTHRVEAGGFERDGMKVYFVSDRGVGFDPRYADKLFGMFERLHNAKDFQGNGVGLAIVKRVVSRHGGTVWAEGSPGDGATFYFSLPARSEP